MKKLIKSLNIEYINSPLAQTKVLVVPPTSAVSHSAMLRQQQRKPKSQRTKLPPKIPTSAVEMPSYMMPTLDVQFGWNLEKSASIPSSTTSNSAICNLRYCPCRRLRDSQTSSTNVYNDSHLSTRKPDRSETKDKVETEVTLGTLQNWPLLTSGDNNPKTIDQIHREVEQEAQERALMAQQNQPRHGGGRGGGREGGRRGPQRAPQMGANGRNTMSRTPLKSVDQSIDITKMKLSKQEVEQQQQPAEEEAMVIGRWKESRRGGKTLESGFAKWVCDLRKAGGILC